MYILQIEVSEIIPASIHFQETNSKFIQYIHCVMLEWFQIRFRTDVRIQIITPLNLQPVSDRYFIDFAICSLNPYIYMEIFISRRK